MRKTTLRLGLAVRGALLAACFGAGASCSADIDTTRVAPRAATLGDDLYGLMCDRVGASSLTEDLLGASYSAVCHYHADPSGAFVYADKVDATALPPVQGADAVRSRALGVAKVEAMARRRSDLVHAFNALLPDTAIPDTVKGSGTIRLHDALTDFAQQLTPLYTSNPYDASPRAEPLFPSQTRSLARLFDALSASAPARAALSHIWGRQGYRPFNVALGAIRAALSFPELRKLTQTSVSLLGPQGTAVPQLQQLLTVTKQELATSVPVVEPMPTVVVEPKTLQPNRPRSDVEFLSALLLSQDETFAALPTVPHRYISVRDHRGFAVPAGSTPGVVGGVPAPFADKNGDGFADVDAFGRFVDASGQPLAVLPPFKIPGLTSGSVDAYDRPATLPYAYVDTSRTFTGAVARTLIPLVDPTQNGPAGSPTAWLTEHETLMYSLAGAYGLYGRRAGAVYDFKTNTRSGAGTCDGCVTYQRFLGEESPLTDLVYAAGQVLGDKDSDAILASTIDLLENHTDVVARLLGAALQIRAISAAHDAAAAAGMEPVAALPYQTPIWEEMASVIARITAHPGLTTALLGALASPQVVHPEGASKHMGETIATMAKNLDRLDYDPNDISGPAFNVTTATPDADPSTPVDENAPRNGDNRSCLQRSLQTIHDANGVKACNKQGATVPSIIQTALGNISLTYPLLGATLNECDLFEFDNLAAFYLDTLLDAGHPKRSQLVIKDGTLNSLTSFLSGVGISTPDQLFQDSSGITGLTTHPSSAALNRLVFFGADSDLYPNMPDHDTLNDDPNNPNLPPTNNFLHSTIEPVSSLACPPDALGVAVCPTPDDTLRIKDNSTIFLWERLGFYDYLRPLVTTFASIACAPDLSSCDPTDIEGEQMFIDIIDVLNRHWPGKDHGSECSSQGDVQTNGKYCSEAGVNRYEPILIDTFQSDLVPALNAFALAATQLSTITVQRGPNAGQTWTGAQVLEKVTQILFDPKYAASVGLTDRHGKATTPSVDGTRQLPVTVYNLFTDALHSIDTTFEGTACSCAGLTGQAATDCARKAPTCQTELTTRQGQWRRARSQLVDAFLQVDGSGPQAAFHNPSTPRMMTSLMRVLREQINANCPDREETGNCPWARQQLASKLEDTLSGPLFASLMDLQESLRADEPSRRTLEGLLTYLLQSTSDDALPATLGTVSDLVQLLADDDNFAPIFNGVSDAANPDVDLAGPGATDTMIKVLKALSGNDYDRYHVLDTVLPAAVTPMDGSTLSPIEIVMDTIADVNRVDASSAGALDPTDYQAILGTVRDFLTSDTRGLEQLYYIVQNRPKQ